MTKFKMKNNLLDIVFQNVALGRGFKIFNVPKHDFQLSLKTALLATVGPIFLLILTQSIVLFLFAKVMHDDVRSCRQELMNLSKLPSGHALSMQYENLADRVLRKADQAILNSAQVAILMVVMGAAVLVILTFLIRRHFYQPLVLINQAMHQFSREIQRVESLQPQPINELNSIVREFNFLTQTIREFDSRRSQYLAGTAHDLKNPLTAIKMAIQLFARQHAQMSDGLKRSQIDLIEKQVIRLEDLVATFMDAVSIESGNFTLRRTRVNLGQIISDSTALWKSTSSWHRLLLHVPAETVWIQGDPVRLEQIVTNLMSNAMKYSPQGGDVFVTLRDTGSHIELCIEDQGIGISADEIQKVFEPYYRSPLTQSLIPGMGIGLWVTKKLVETHAGAIQVKSKVGVGSVFEVRIPKSIESDEATVV